MTTQIGGLVGTQLNADGATPYARQGKHGGALIVDNLHTRFYELASRGMVYMAASAVAGVALPIYSETAQLFMIWNPADSGYNLELLCAAWGKVSTTGSDGHLCWAYKTSMGSATGTGAPCSAYTAGTPVNALLGQDGDSGTHFAPLTATVTAPSYLRPVGITQTEVADAQTDPPFTMIEDFNVNPLIVAPGSAIFACQSVAASTVYSVCVTYAKIPIS